ncbi:NPCBM/NEW2 domain-containing protein [Paenibacillus oryzisoli]|uniref:stalk domain-containing protein n=1 Tax=Paenibacillus oryzisoli TaxID=1850517 RepID=UPI003D2CC104
MNKTFKAKHLIASFLAGSLFFSGISFAASSSNIEVFFQPLKYYFDGIEKMAPDDQQGFIYNGTTYVPLRFVAESLGQKVDYDGPTTSIYVGKPKEGQVTYMEEMKTHTYKNIYNDDSNQYAKQAASFTTNTGVQFTHGYTYKTYSCNFAKMLDLVTYEYLTNGQYKSFEAFIAPDSGWNKLPKTDNIGQIKIYADEKLVYDSGGVSSDISKPIKVAVDLTGALKVKVVVSVGGFCSSASSIGLLDAKFIN